MPFFPCIWLLFHCRFSLYENSHYLANATCFKLTLRNRDLFLGSERKTMPPFGREANTQPLVPLEPLVALISHLQKKMTKVKPMRYFNILRF